MQKISTRSNYKITPIKSYDKKPKQKTIVKNCNKKQLQKRKMENTIILKKKEKQKNSCNWSIYLIKRAKYKKNL